MKSWTYIRLILLSFCLAACSRNPLGEDLAQPILNLGFILSQSCTNTLTQDNPYTCTITPSEDIPDLVYSIEPGTTCTWATINPTTAVVSGTPNDDGVGTCQVVVGAKSPKRKALALSYDVQVENTAPTLSITNALNITEDAPLTLIRNDAAVQASEEGFGTYGFDHANTTAPRCSDNATLVIDPTTGAVSYAPAPDYFGTCYIRVSFDDGNAVANSIVTSEFSITVTPVNDAPRISPIAAQTTYENIAAVVPVNIVDVDSPIACSSANVTVTSSAHAIVAPSGISIGGSIPNCTVTLNPVTYANGITTINVAVTDGSLSANTNFTLEVLPVPDPPVLLPIANQLGSEDTPLSFNINITDPDTALACNSTFLSATSSNTTLLPTAGVTYSGLPPNCTVILYPALNQNGSSSLTISLTDGVNVVAQSFSATFSAVNDVPVISSIVNQVTNEDTPLVVNFTITDVDNTLTCGASVSASSSNTALLPVAGISFGGTAPNCTATLTPLANANGLTNLSFTVTDGALTAVRNFSLTVDPVNDAPVLSNISNQTTLEDTPITINFTLNDIDSPVSCTTSMTASSSNASLLPVAGISFGGTAPNCTATFTSGLDQSGVSNIVFTANDGFLTATQNFTYTVTGIDDPPVLSVITNQNVNEDASLVVNFTVNDADSTLACTTSMSATSSNVGLLPVASIVFGGTAPNCTATLTPLANQNGTTNLVFTLTDGTTPVTQSFSLAVTPVNDAPVLSVIPAQTAVESTPLVINFTLTDIDSPIACNTALSGTSSNTTLLPVANMTFAGTAPNCTLTVNPVTNQNGTTNISVTATDGLLTDVKNFVLTVTAYNDAPVISNISNLTILEDNIATVNFTITDVDNTLSCNTSMAAVSSNTALVPVNRVVFSGTAPNCTATITPLADANGVTNLDFTVTDGSLTDVSSFSLTVSAVNDSPVISAITNQITSEDTPLVINFTISDVDSAVTCNTSMSATSSNTALLPVSGVIFGGTAPNCTATLTAASNANGVSNLGFTVTDGALTAVQSFTYTVSAVNDAPVLSTITNQITSEDTPVVVNFTVNDVDSVLLCSSLNLTATSSNTGLLPVANIVFAGTAPNCTATLTPVNNLSGVSNLSITLADNGTPNLQDVKNFTFTVSAINDAPVLSVIANQLINEDTNVIVNFTITDIDDTLTCGTSVSASSSNTALLPLTNIAFGGTAPNCTATITPVANANGLSNLSFTVTDGVLTDIKNFSFTVTPVNDAPVMSAIGNQSTPQDTPLVVNFTVADVDNTLACNTAISATSSNIALLPVANIVFGGTAPNCTATLSPVFLQSGMSNVSFTVTDGTLTDVKSFSFSASAVNYPPTISSISAKTTNEDVPLAVNFTINDIDSPIACNTSISATSSNTTLLPTGGIVFTGTAPNCTATLTSAANLSGSSNLVFTLTDGTNPVTTSFTLTVTPVNDAPVMSVIANQITSENIPITVNFTVTDIDSTLSCSTGLVATSSNTALVSVGGITFGGTAPNCTATITPISLVNGLTNLSFTISDGSLSDVKNFSLTVTPVNDPPVMSTIANQTTLEDAPLVVNFTITDPDDTLNCMTSVSATSSNTALLPVAGVLFGGTAPNCTATLTSALNANGSANLNFTVTDGVLTDVKSFTLTVTPVNDAPAMSTITNQTSPEDTPLVVNFTINDVDSTLSCLTSVSATSSNTALLPVAGISFGGTAPNCTATLTTLTDAIGVSNLSFSVTDGSLSDVKNFTFTVTNLNDAPVLSTITNKTVSEDNSLAVNFTITDVDSTLSCTTSMSATSSNTTVLPASGILFSGTAPNCTVTITPAADTNGTSNLSFTVTDGSLNDVKNFTLTVTPVNDAPVMSTIANQTTPEDTPLVVNFTINDIDSTLTCAASVSASTSNTTILPLTGIVFGGTAPNCTATLTPSANLSGASNLSFTLTDGSLTDIKNFSFTVTAVNDAPVIAAIATQTTSEDTALPVTFTITDIDSTLNCTTSMIAASSNATLIPVGGILFSGTAPNCIATVTPAANLSGTSNLTFTVSDGSLSDAKTFAFNVTAVNDAPVLSAITNQTTAEDTLLVLNFTITDIDSVLLCTSLNLSLTSSNTTLLPVANVVYSGTAPNCTATFTPAADANGSTNLSLTLMDNGSPNLQDVENFTLTVTPVNDAPTMPVIANQTTLEDTPVTVNFTIADVDNTLACNTAMTASSSSTTIIPVSNIVFGGTAPNCTATITPALNQNGNVNLTFRVSDGTLNLDRTFQLTVTPVDDAPIISTIANQTINEDGSVVVNFTITDVDSTLNCTTSMSKTSSNTTMLPVANVVFGGTAPNCTVTLTPVANSSGSSNVNLTVTDGTTPASEAFTLTVTPQNDAPVISTLANNTVVEDTVVVTNFTITDVDNILDCNTSMSALSSNTALVPVSGIVFGGTAPNCTATITPVVDASGATNLTFTVTDGSLTDAKTFTLTYTAVNDPPVISSITTKTTTEDTPLAVSFTITDVDSTLSCTTAMTSSSSNTALITSTNIVFGGTAPNCTATLTPLPDANGTTNLTFTVTDGATPVSQTFTFNVNPVNDLPIISAIPGQSTLEDTPLVLNFTITDVDNILSCTGSSMNVTSSNVTLLPAANIVFSGTAPNCTATFTPAANRFGSSNVSFFVSDGIGTAIRTFNVAVTAVNDAPLISAISAQSTLESTPIAINFTISDVDNGLACDSGSLSMTSSNVAVIPTVSVVWSGTAPNCTATLTPAGTNYGTSNIEFIVTDGTLTATSAFVQTVINVNQAPTITMIQNQVIYEGRPNTINFTLNDNDGPLTCTSSNLSMVSSNTTLLPNANVVFSGTYPNCTAVISIANGQSGSSTASIVVTDTVATGNSTFIVTGNKITSVALSPLTPIVPKNSNFSFTLSAVYTDGQTKNVTTTSTWTTSNTAISSFPSAGVLNNTYAGAAVATSTITATYGAFTTNTVATINPATITSLMVNPTSANINVGSTVQIRCIGITSDGGALDLTQSCNWASANALIASVNNSMDKGLVTGVSLGSATNITATYGAYSAAAAVTVDTNTPVTSDNGTGLKAQYYTGAAFNTLTNTRIDATVNFNWAAGNNPAGSADTFTVRWTGFVKAPTTGTYTFYTQSDDGVRIWVNGVQLINNWTAHSSAENSGTIALTAGTKYSIIVEFFENSGSAQCELRYAGPSVTKQIVPQINLYPP